jgi:hypothetical protein
MASWLKASTGVGFSNSMCRCVHLLRKAKCGLWAVRPPNTDAGAAMCRRDQPQSHESPPDLHHTRSTVICNRYCKLPPSADNHNFPAVIIS